MICPAETPEGQAVGLVKNLALMAKISVGAPTKNIKDFLEDWGLDGLDEISPESIKDRCKVFINGDWAGCFDEAETLCNTLKEIRRKGHIRNDTSIVRDIINREVKIFTDAGRAMRPLYVVDSETGELRIRKGDVEKVRAMSGTAEKGAGWNHLMASGVIEYIDCEEEETSMVAMFHKDLIEKGKSIPYTHCEIHPSLILGTSPNFDDADPLAPPGAEAYLSKTKKDCSMCLRSSESGVVDTVMLSVNSKGSRFVKVKDGVVPDLLMNPHAVPSRMTIGHLVECLLGKTAAIIGGEGDATPFNDVSHIELQ
ncbi:uncharacterized protein EMH_0047700 [Eimeria mitis]|uniref:DNA-directed RNA polymerase subunit beta n=1 Tax=Eimeria mitis TaxID=44415 RepID=U6K0A7_9EIME|nr:uncharacterized protein EMH_0047700 [Eimeria mitis]CDJ29198.1 hypothetical protein EMH_0047700 [Eimeria mitis]